MKKPGCVVIGIVLLAIAGCGKTKPKDRKEVFPVHGSVWYEDKPAVGAEVTFHPVGEHPIKATCPYGAAGDDGRFALSTYGGGDGAPAGEYTVTIVWPGPPPENSPGDPPPDRLNGRYNNLSRAAWHISVKPQANDLDPFQLQ